MDAISNYLCAQSAEQMLVGLPYRHFSVITADVPWRYRVRSTKGLGRSAEKHYKTMDLHRIARLNVEAHAAPDAFLLFWVTGPFLAIGAHIPIMKSWGFTPTAIWGVWLKPVRSKWEHGQLFLDDAMWRVGMGHTSRQNAEFVVIGRRGNPKRMSRSVRQIITEPAREHSRKPDKFFRNCEAFGAGPYLELFGREQRDGWTVRGDESTKFRD